MPLVHQVPLGLAGELDRECVADLLRAPPLHQFGLHEVPQVVVVGQFARSRPRSAGQRFAVRAERPVITGAADVAADLPLMVEGLRPSSAWIGG